MSSQNRIKPDIKVIPGQLSIIHPCVTELAAHLPLSCCLQLFHPASPLEILMA